MDPDLPFVHPPQEPTDAQVAAARHHVDRQVRRRRTRRRLAASGSVLAVVLVAAVAVAAIARHDAGDETVYAGQPDTTATPRLGIDADTPWDAATLSADGRTLTIEVGNQPEGTGPCQQSFRHDVAQTAAAVTVGFQAVAPTSTTAPALCVDTFQPQTFQIRLDAPLGDRPVYDGVQRQPRTIHRLGDLVQVTGLPDGWAPERAAPLDFADGTSGWQQDFRKDGEDWYLYVIQAPAGWYRPASDTTATERLTVGGHDATRTEWFNRTAHTIHWTQDGLDLTVTGEAQGPPTFTHDDELLRIAAGIRLPEAGVSAQPRPLRIQAADQRDATTWDLTLATCHTDDRVQVAETATHVIVAATTTDPAGTGLCADVATVELSRPLGDRALVDGATGTELRCSKAPDAAGPTCQPAS